jgi:hypothetical protein
MAVYFLTSDAHRLLKAFDARIAQKEQEGKITTWEKSEDGKYYTHRRKSGTPRHGLSRQRNKAVSSSILSNLKTRMYRQPCTAIITAI